MLVVEDLHAFYGRAHILHGVSLEAHAGDAPEVAGARRAGLAPLGRAAPAATDDALRSAQADLAVRGGRIRAIAPSLPVTAGSTRFSPTGIF